MNTLLHTFTEALQNPDVQRALVLIGLKSTVILALGGLVAWTLREASSARRHLVWSMALASVVLLPVLELALPTWQVGLVAAPRVERLTVAPHAPVVVEAPAEPLLLTDDGFVVLEAPEAPAPWPAPMPPAVPPLAWLGLLWAGVAGSIALFYLVGLVRLNTWTGKAEPVEDDRIRQAARDVVWELDVTRSVALRWTDDAVTPLTFGVWRPVVLLPRAAQQWDDEKLRVVLLHEFAHIRRFDALTQMVAQVACALFWFNPLVWWGAHQLRVERERACDDYVLERGTRASAYASHLLDIARTLRARTPVGVVSMAHRGELEGRLLAILEPERRREILSRAVTLGVGVLFAAVLLPLAAFKPWEVQAQHLHATYQVELPAPAEIPEPPAPPEPLALLESGEDGFDTIRRSFDVKPGGTFVVETDLGSIEVEPGTSDRVEVLVESNVDELEVGFDQRGNEVVVRGKLERARTWRWGRNQRVSFRVRVPQRFNVNLNTSGGSIEVGDLEGTVRTSTSGGSLSFGRIKGTVRGKTSGGSIRLDGTTGDVDVRTSGGSIQLGNVGGTVEAHTSGGSIQIEEVGGDVNAHTSGGSVTATITRQPRGRCSLETSGGSVRVRLAPGLDLDLDASTNGGRVVSDFHPEHAARERRSWGGDRLEDRIGQGGPELRLRTSAGSIYVNRLDGRRSETGALDAARDKQKNKGKSLRYSYDFTTDDGHAYAGEAEASVAEFGESLGEIIGMALDGAVHALDGVDWQAEMAGALSELDDAELREVERALAEAQRDLADARRDLAADLADAQRDMAQAQREMEREVQQARRELSPARRAEVEAALRDAQRDLHEAQREASQSMHESQREIQQALLEAQRHLREVQRERAARQRGHR